MKRSPYVVLFSSYIHERTRTALIWKQRGTVADHLDMMKTVRPTYRPGAHGSVSSLHYYSEFLC